ncbi:hypothetical protein BX666DRAFT_2011674 [Dichotomocladium elegans]|nr:hypothetical protein BX666DRAFT_2011674 [Dichotomocladium elegans]
MNFLKLNDQIDSDCTNLHVGRSYCVETSITYACKHTYKVVRSDTCATIAKKYDISIGDFYKWNWPLDENNCSNLRRGRSYCVALRVRTTKKFVTAKTGTVMDTMTDLVIDSRKKIQARSAFTYYWIAHNEDYKGGAKVTIKTCSGVAIGQVNENFANALVMEGTGVVDDKIVNLGSCSCSNYRCFEILDRSKEPYGITAYGTALKPYISIAANDIPRGTKIYVPALDGWKLPNSGKIHNGCLLVDDQSWSFKSNHIDLYVYERENYKALDKSYPTTEVDVYEGGNCKLLHYM